MAAQTPHTADPRLALRRRMERAVDRLLAAMDAMDGDPDLEDEEDDQCEDEGAPTGDDEPEEYN